MSIASLLRPYLFTLAAFAGLCQVGRIHAASAPATPDFVEPDVVRSQSGNLYLTLNAAYAYNTIGSDQVYLRSFNGKLVGPTIRAKPGDTLYITLKNSLPVEPSPPNAMNTLHELNTINMHYHGLHVSPGGISDNVLLSIAPGATQEYQVHIPLNHPPGTYWYHPHRHGSTAGTVASGMSGALIIEGGLDAIPEIQATKDRVMVLNQIPYDNRPVTPGGSKGPGVVEVKDGTIFGLGSPPFNDWFATERYTTINGVALSTIRMQPGQIERWRFIHSGQGEHLQLRFVNPTAQPKVLPKFQEIAVDGLALGKMQESPSIELWPGNRSDVLVQAPTAPGEYLLIDDSPFYAPLPETMLPLRTVARIIVEGPAVSQKMPTNDQMAGLRLPSIRDNQITGYQETKYGIQSVGGKYVFMIDGKTFDESSGRILTLGDVDEWTIWSANDPADRNVNGVVHPFHIHVNPFEVTAIMAPSPAGSKDLFENLLTDGPVWRDTVKIPAGGYVKMRTRYEDFVGNFVQHCHILDHEDQGMMELVSILHSTARGPKPIERAPVSGSGSLTRDRTRPQTGNVAALTRDVSRSRTENVTALPRVGAKAPDFTLPNAVGKDNSLRELTQGKPSVVFFFKGHGCSHCALQVAAFSEHLEEFAKRGIQVIGVTSDDLDTLKADEGAAEVKFALLADPQGIAFAKFGCVDAQGLRHGTFALDASGQVKWATAGASPYLAVRDLLKL
jgi:FtsP/CotA-like multicopper oxidase with cupredoxin domain/peroxiredoxin